MTMERAVICIVKEIELAERVIGQLREAGIASDRISVLFPDRQGTRYFVYEQNTKAPEGAVAGASAGGLAGGALGWLVGIGSLAIPGLGPLIAAGPILAGLSAAAVGAAVGGLTGALVGMGMPEYEAKQYEDKIKSGNTFISVHTDDGDQRGVAKKIFENAGAEDIRTTCEAMAG
jgi:hypothetical protein